MSESTRGASSSSDEVGAAAHQPEDVTRPASGRGGTAVALFAGSALIGLSGYVFLAFIGHGRFDPSTAAALSAAYLLSNILGPGIFIAIEQETARAVSAALAQGTMITAIVRRMALLSGVLVVATTVVLGLATLALLDAVLDGRVGLLLALVLSVLGSGLVFVVRGLASGTRRFRRYALTLMIDGAARIIGCVTLAIVGSTDATAFALVFCAGPLVAGLLTAGNPRSAQATTRGGSAAQTTGSLPSTPTVPSVARLAQGMTWLLVASFCSFALANLAPVIATGMLRAEPAVAAGFATAVVLTRVPLLLMGPVQAVLLPRLTAATTSGDHRAYRRDLVMSLLVLTGLGLLAVAGTWALGRPVIALLFGEALDTTSTGVLVLLTTSAMLFMAVQLFQPALVAVGRHRALVAAWLSGAAAFGASFALPLDPVAAATVAQLAGPIVTLVCQLAFLARSLRVAN